MRVHRGDLFGVLGWNAQSPGVRTLWICAVRFARPGARADNPAEVQSSARATSGLCGWRQAVRRLVRLVLAPRIMAPTRPQSRYRQDN
jgi:hypothetical protein